MNTEKLEIFSNNPPATEEEINNAESKTGVVIPDVYKEFLRIANGVDLNNCVLYDTDRITEAYFMYEFDEYAPEYISIGNDNGDYEIVMRAEKDALEIGFLEQGSIGITPPENIQDFRQWVENGCITFDDYDDDED